MRTFASAVILIYAAVLIAGGIVGWRMSGSRISFTSSLFTAFLLTTAYSISRSSPADGYLVATVVALALAGFFALRFWKTRRFLPSGMMLLVSIVAVILLGWVTARFW